MSRVLVVSPSTFGYERRITSAVSELGHEVHWHDERIGNDFLSKVVTRLRLLWLLPRFKTNHTKSITTLIRDVAAEKLLLINPETLNGNDLRKLKQVEKNLEIIVYKWDSVKQKPIDELMFEYADKVYSFDPEDCRQNTLLAHLPLFHSHEANKMAEKKSTNLEYEFVFVGTAQFHRIRVLAKLSKYLSSTNRDYVFYLVSQSLLHHVLYKIAALYFGYKGRLSNKSLEYLDYLELIDNSLCVVDVEYPNQSGLTMRSIEVLFSNSSILTTNSSLKEYNLADIGGVFVFDDKAIEVPDRQALEQEKDDRLFTRYSIKSWVNSLLNGQEGLVWNGKRWA